MHFPDFGSAENCQDKGVGVLTYSFWNRKMLGNVNTRSCMPGNFRNNQATGMTVLVSMSVDAWFGVNAFWQKYIGNTYCTGAECWQDFDLMRDLYERRNQQDGISGACVRWPAYCTPASKLRWRASLFRKPLFRTSKLSFLGTSYHAYPCTDADISWVRGLS